MKIQSTPQSSSISEVNRKVISLIFRRTGGPHGLSEFNSYTVPAGKKARLYSFNLSIAIVLPATVVSESYNDLTIKLAGGANVTVHRVTFNSIPVVQISKMDVSSDMTLFAGDKIFFRTFDGNTGGTAAYLGTCFIIESDA